VGNWFEGLEQGEAHRRTSNLVLGVGRRSSVVRVLAGGRRRGLRARRGVRGRGETHGGYVSLEGRWRRPATRRRSKRRVKSTAA
jgi:hypothetical protein